MKNKMAPYLVSIALVALTTFLGAFVRKTLEPANLVIFYLLIVVIIAVRWGKGPAIMASLLSVLAFDFFLVTPYLTFAVSDVQYMFTFTGLLIVGLVVSALASKTRQQAIEAAGREEQTAMLYRLSKDLAATDSLETVLDTIRMNVSQIFDCSAALFLQVEHTVTPSSVDSGFPINEHEKAIAAWTYENGKPAGWGTDTLPAAKAYYFPLKTSQGPLGVVGICFKESKKGIEPREEHLLSALASQTAVAIQRAKLAEVSRQMELVRQTEKLQAALLNSISHDLRTPLVSITGVLSGLLQDLSPLDSATRKELLETAYEESVHLNQLVGNLLDMTRIEAGTLKVRLSPCELRDVLGASLQVLKDKVEQRDIRIDIPSDLPEIPMDFTLMMRVLMNLVDNAVKYSASDTLIEITAKVLNDHMEIKIKDEGFGIPSQDLEHIFDKFYRALKPRQITGTGLGLSICRGIVEAHGGRILAENNLDKGATFTVSLPLARKED